MNAADQNAGRSPDSERQTSQIQTVNWLCGLMALSIMLFYLWAFGDFSRPFDASTFLGKFGIYDILISFVLYGLSMAIGYDPAGHWARE